MHISTRQHLNAGSLLKKARQILTKTFGTKKENNISTTDCLMSGLALFGLKYPSLLQFEQDQKNEEKTIRSNLKTLYGVEQAPCDTYLRERLDEVDPHKLRPLYKSMLAQLQRGKVLESFQYLDGYYLLLLDGTGYFSSHKIHCTQCLEKHHRNGKTTYSHQMLGAVLAHPERKEVIPFAPEPILKQDGATKNDCERNAAKRFLTHLRREHPHMKFIVTEDGLSSNAPHIRCLKELDLRFILGAKPGDHAFLFDRVNQAKTTQVYEITDEKGYQHRFRYLNHVPLNDSNSELEVNFFEYWETSPKGKVQHFSWVTDILIHEGNLMPLMRGGRARWKVENETFNTLKNQGYHFEHNFGHGYKYLSTVFIHLMMLAFLIDQIQQCCCRLTQKAIKKVGSKIQFWEKIRARFMLCLIPDWETLYRSILSPLPEALKYDTS